MKDRKIQIIIFVIVASLLATPVLCLAKAGGGYRGGRGSSQGGALSSGSAGSRGSRTFDQNGFAPIERSAAAPGVAVGTPRATGPTAAPAGVSAPAAQASFFQRHPLLSGIGAGLAGSWIGHMLFGPTASPAATHEDSTRQQEGYEQGSSGPSMGFLLAIMAFIGVGLYFFYKRHQSLVSPVFVGRKHSDLSVSGSAPAWVPASVGVLSPSPSTEPRLTDGDQAEFRRLLIEIQTAWSRQDVQRLRHLTTPEMCQYFSDKLAENVSAGVENRVEDIIVIRAEVCECWAEEGRVYGTVLLQWKARDYVRSLDQSTSDPGSLIEGNDRIPTEAREVWTFVRHQQGKWLLSAIQQV
jgi:hypothetical protein